MALIKCKNCGHMVSDKGLKCPKCGSPIEKSEFINSTDKELKIISDTTNNEVISRIDEHTDEPLIESKIIKKGPKKNRTWIWVLIVALLCLVVGGGYCLFNQSVSRKAEKETLQIENVNRPIPDGNYCYKGEWESSRYASQPCKVEFTKKDNILLDCSYTNLKYNSQIPLNGTITSDKLHFIGEINGKQLVIDLMVSSDGNFLIGEGIDYAHNGDKAKLNLTEADYSAIDGEKYRQKNRQESAIPAGLTFRTFTKNDKENGNTIQSRLANETIISNLKKLGFALIDRTTESRPDYTGEGSILVTVETYSKAVNGNVTTVKLESEYTEIHFPNFNDVEEFKKTVRDCGLKETEDGFMDSEDIYWAGTDVSFDGTIVTLRYKIEA